MARNSAIGSVGKGALGVGVGFALYMLISSFGGGGFGWGRGQGRGEGAGPGTSPAVPPPSPGTGPARARIMLSPQGITVDGKAMTLDEAVEAVRAARDVEVVVTGDTIQGDVDDLLVALFLAGITWWGRESLVKAAPRSMDDVRRRREEKLRAAEWDKLSEAEKKARREAAIEEAKRNAPPTDEELRKIAKPKVGWSSNARGQYGRGRHG
jgi:hypothetical protein